MIQIQINANAKLERWYLYENQYVQMVFWLRLDYLTYNIVHETESWLRQIDLDTIPYYEVHILNSDTNYANTISIIYKKDRSMIYYRAFEFCIWRILKIICLCTKNTAWFCPYKTIHVICSVWEFLEGFNQWPKNNYNLIANGTCNLHISRIIWHYCMFISLQIWYGTTLIS